MQIWYDNGKRNMSKVTFHDIQKFLWEGHKRFSIDIESIRDDYYRQRVPCSSFCCLFSKLRKKLTMPRTRPRDPMRERYGFVNIVLRFKD